MLSTGSETTTSSRASGSSRSFGENSGRASRRSGPPRDTLDREFIETGIDALRRLSGGGVEVALPSWTITRYEVEREEKIGMGFFSDVYRGTWRDGVVAIKVLAPTTPKQLFVHEVSGVFFVGRWGTLWSLGRFFSACGRRTCGCPAQPVRARVVGLPRISDMRQMDAPPFSPRFPFYAAQARDRRDEVR